MSRRHLLQIDLGFLVGGYLTSMAGLWAVSPHPDPVLMPLMPLWGIKFVIPLMTTPVFPWGISWGAALCLFAIPGKYLLPSGVVRLGLCVATPVLPLLSAYIMAYLIRVS